MNAPDPPRSPWQLVYGALLRARRERAAGRAARLPAPVISIGNLHWGGGGKTPFTIAVAARLRDRGLGVAILSRGYGRRSRGPLLVSRGAGPLLPWNEAGDEPFLLARELPGVAVAVGESRVAAGRLALSELERPPQVFVLDDGFSHVALARDLEILLFPSADPFAGGRLAPGGRLREPLAAARAADAVVLTGAVEADAGRELAQALAPFGYAGPGFASRTAISLPPLAEGERVVAVAGIARPEPFFAALAAAGVAVAERLAFPDHHDYPEASRKRIDAALRQSGAETVVTTAKDALKLEERLATPPAVVEIRAAPEASFFHFLDRRVDALLAARDRA